MTIPFSASVSPVARLARLGACGLLALLAASSSACSSPEAESSSDDDGGETEWSSEGEDATELAGVWRAWPEGHGSFDVNIEDGKGLIVRFGPGFEIGNPEVLNGGDPFLTRLTRINARKFSARVARVEVGDSPTFPKTWPTAVTYVDTTLEWNEAASRWKSSAPPVEFSKGTTFGGSYAPAGACEKKFANIDNATLYLCEYPQDGDGCSSAGEKAFWPSTDCERLGYGFRSSGIGTQWQKSSSSNVTPGAQGKWGDGTGGTKMVSAAASAAGEGAAPSNGATGGSACLHGTWRTDTCNGAKTHTLSFTTANNGHYVMPDCNGVCTKPLDYHYDYSVSGSNVTLRYTGSSEILCDGSPVTPPKPTSNDTLEFSCAGDTLTTTTSLGTKTYTRVK